MGAEQGGNRQTAAGIDKEEKTNIVRTYNEEERRKPGERIIKGNMPGGRARGKAKMRRMENIKTWTGLAMEELLRLVENRQGWRNVVQNASNPRGRVTTEQLHPHP